jgi:hypothetical protein
MLTYSSEGGEQFWKSDRGQLSIRLLSPTAALLRFKGYLTTEFITPIIRTKDPLFENGLVTSLNDWDEMEGYNSESRRLLTDWVLRRRKGYQLCAIYSRSTLVKMGVATANIVLGGFLVVPKSREEFEAMVIEASLSHGHLGGDNPRLHP